VKILCDTDAIVASIAKDHKFHAEAWHLLQLVSSGKLCGFVSTHSLAEIYSILTRVPFQPRFSPSQVWRVLREDVLTAFELVPLDQDDYRRTIEYCAEGHLVGGRIYDALHIAAARKAGCDIIYTFNVRHFRELAPDLATRIRAPQLP
jgi:predicted nucleic acid-binding protein